MKKKIFCYVRIPLFKESIFIFNQIYLYLKTFISIGDAFDEFFYSMIFGSQIWSSIC